MGLRLDTSKSDKMLHDIGKTLGDSGSVVIGPLGYHKEAKGGSTLTGDIMYRHVAGKGVPVRDPMGFGSDGKKYWNQGVGKVMTGKWTVKRFLVNVGDYMSRLQRLRMTRGIDVDGKDYKEYSDRYELKRIEANRSRRPNLQWTDGTMESINYVVFNRT